MVVLKQVIAGNYLYILAEVTDADTEEMVDPASLSVNIGQVVNGELVALSGSPFTMTKVFGAVVVYGVAVPVGSVIDRLNTCVCTVNVVAGGVEGHDFYPRVLAGDWNDPATWCNGDGEEFDRVPG